MRENRPYGSEGGGAELNRLSLPLSNIQNITSSASPPGTFHRQFSRPAPPSVRPDRAWHPSLGKNPSNSLHVIPHPELYQIFHLLFGRTHDGDRLSANDLHPLRRYPIKESCPADALPLDLVSK